MTTPARRSGRWLATLVITALLVTALTTFLGPSWLTFADMTAPFRAPAPDEGPAFSIFWSLRVPRTLLAALAGAGLSVAGVILQALFRNPLASPYTLGIASGASLAAAAGFLTGVSGYVLGIPKLTMLALGGAAVAMSLVYLMARLRGSREMTHLLLAGVCVAYLGASGVMLTTLLADGTVTKDIVRWMMGSLAVLRPRASLEVAVILFPVLAFAIWSHRDLDLLTVDEQFAATRGVAVSRTIWGGYLAAGLLTAVIVAECGPIGFVGLMAPHIMRRLVGEATLPLLIGSAAGGAAFLAVCDGLARALFVREIEVGVITNLLGAAFFFWLLATRPAR